MCSRESRGEEAHQPYDLLVVGGGMAGLTASAFAAQKGYRVLLCEKEPVLGGLVRSFERNGFVWDAGIRAIEDSGIIFPMLEALGVTVDFAESPVSLGIEDRVISIESEENLKDYRSLLEHFYPDREKDIARILHVIRRVMKHMDVLYGIENPAFKDLRNDRAYLFNQLLPWLGKFLLTIGKIQRMSQPVDAYLQGLTDSRALIDMISQHFFQKTPAFFALSYFSLYLDYVYPVGGTGTLTQTLERFCLEHGVDIHRETRISRVDLLSHTATDGQGAEYAYRKLVWAADLKEMYRVANLDALPEGSMKRRARERAARVEGAIGGDSVFTLYASVDLEPAWFAQRSTGHFFYTSTRKGVGGDIFAQLRAILTDVESQTEKNSIRQQCEAWIRRYIDSTTYEISIPALKDPTLAPPGKTGLIISVLFDYELCKAAQAGGWYEDLKMLVENEMLDVLSATAYPRLKDAVNDRFSATPLSIERIAGTSEGAITGWAFTNPVIPAERRMQTVARSVKTDLPDVYQAGQWAYSPSGVPIAILTGKLAADRVIRDLRRAGKRGTGI